MHANNKLQQVLKSKSATQEEIEVRSMQAACDILGHAKFRVGRAGNGVEVSGLAAAISHLGGNLGAHIFGGLKETSDRRPLWDI